MNDDYIYVKLKIPRRNFNINFSGQGGGILRWIQASFERDDRAEQTDIRKDTIDQMGYYMNQMKFRQYYFLIASDEEVQIAQYMTREEFLSKDDFVLSNENENES